MSQATSKPVTLFDHRGEPIKASGTGGVTKAAGSFIEAISQARMPATFKARDAYVTHAYVYAAATAIAMNLSQVGIGVWKETDSGDRVPRAGVRRSAVKRHLSHKSRWSGKRVKQLEEQFDHPLTAILDHPNPLMQSSADLIYATALFLSLRGECFWLPLNVGGTPWVPGQPFDSIITLHPDNVVEDLDVSGNLVGWTYTRSKKDTGLELGARLGQRRSVRLLPSELVHFKYFNPEYPLRGISRITATAMGIVQDLLAQQHNSAILENGAEPGGYLSSEKAITNEDERKSILKSWKDKHGGSNNRNKTALLHGGLKWNQVALSNSDMQAIEMRKWNREEILAVMGVPKSIVSVDENLNYSIQLSQDKNFWNKCLIPIVRIIETTLDSTLLFAETDDLMVAFDLSVVEALQEDLRAKADTADVLINKVRVPPDVALEKVGIDLEDLPGGDVVLVSPMLVPIDTVINPEIAPEPLPAVDDEPVDPEEEAKSKRPAPKRLKNVRSMFIETAFAKMRGTTTVSWRAVASKKSSATATSFRRLIGSYEPTTKQSWVSHINFVRKDQLEKFDAFVRENGVENMAKVLRAMTPDMIERVLFDLAKADKNIKAKFRPKYEKMQESVVQFTEKELGGLYVFDIDSPEALKFMDDRTSKVTGTNRTVREKLKNTLNNGIKNGDSVSQLRNRITKVMNRQVSAARATTIARTEVAQTFGGMRDMVFDKEGVTKSQWTSAGDDHVREDHTTFAGAGEQDRRTNYMDFVGRGDETLHFPSDPEGPADQVINCRCVEVATG